MADDEFDQLPVVPLGDRKLRACMITGLVKTEEQVRAAAVHAFRLLLCYRQHDPPPRPALRNLFPLAPPLLPP